MPAKSPPPLAEPEAAPHIEETVQRMAELHAVQASSATPLQRAVTAATQALANPVVLVLAVIVALAWVTYNGAGARLHWPLFDPPPFLLLETSASVLALFTALLILASQRREEEFERRRAQLTLQMAALTEQKVAKVIGLLEEQRHENPLLPERKDMEAEDMAKASDPRQVLDRIIETHENAPEPDKPPS